MSISIVKEYLHPGKFYIIMTVANYVFPCMSKGRSSLKSTLIKHSVAYKRHDCKTMVNFHFNVEQLRQLSRLLEFRYDIAVIILITEYIRSIASYLINLLCIA